MYPYFKLGGHEFSSYWTIFAAGILLALLVSIIRSKKRGLSILHAVLLSLSADIASLIGAKILFYLENISVLMETGVRLSGVSFFGSLFFAPAGVYLCSRIIKSEKSFLSLLDFVSPALMLILAILRVGCFVCGCCGGISVTLAGHYFSKFPTQLTECFFDLGILAGLLAYEKFCKKEGRLYFFIMLYYGILRFILEFVRDTPKDWLCLSHGQWFAIISVIISGYILHCLEKKDRKNRVYTHSRKRRR